MKAEESSPGGKCKRTGNLLCVCLLSPGHASEWQTCVSVPPFKKSFTSGETPGPRLWRLYISIHNWWPGPRQTAHYTCNMDSLLVSDACPRLDLTLSHHCVWRGNGERDGVCVCENVCVCTCKCVCMLMCVLYGCCSPTLCFPALVWLMLLTADSWFWFSSFSGLWNITLISYKLLFLFCFLFYTFLVPVHQRIFTIDRHTVG